MALTREMIANIHQPIENKINGDECSVFQLLVYSDLRIKYERILHTTVYGKWDNLQFS